MIKAIALDDEPPALQLLNHFCGKTELVELEKTFVRSTDALKYLNNYPVDLLFLDINMPAVSGIDFYKNLPNKVMVIFTTAYSEYAVEGFNLNAIDYLLKPFAYNRLLQAVEKAKAYYDFVNQRPDVAKQEFLFIRVNYGLVKIAFADILYVEGLDDYLKIHLNQQKPLVVRFTMKAMLEKLPAQDFLRAHRSYIVSIKHIESVRNKIIIIGGEEIPISTSYEIPFFKLFSGGI